MKRELIEAYLIDCKCWTSEECTHWTYKELREYITERGLLKEYYKFSK